MILQTTDQPATVTLLEQLLTPLSGLSPLERVGVVLAFGIAGHLTVRALKVGTRWLLTSKPDGQEDREAQLQHRHPKFATLISLVANALIFVIYFAAIGLALREANVRITTYLASASVIGLAVGFGTQGLVQDIVTGLTLIFSDYLRIGDVIEIAGQTGTVDQVGLRFTRLTNFVGATIVVPNRNIGQMARYRRDVIRVYVDARVPPGMTAEEVHAAVTTQASGLRDQYPATIVSEPEVFAALDAADGAWQYIRVKFRIWPGQQELITKTYQPALANALRKATPEFQDWMISTTLRVE